MSYSQKWSDLYHEENQIKPGKGFIIRPHDPIEDTINETQKKLQPTEWYLEPVVLHNVPKEGYPCLIPVKVWFNVDQTTLGYALWDSNQQKVCEIQIFRNSKTFYLIEGSPELLEDLGYFKDNELFRFEFLLSGANEGDLEHLQKYFSLKEVLSGIFDMGVCYKIDQDSIHNSTHVESAEMILHEKLTNTSLLSCEDGMYLIRGLGYFKNQSILPIVLLINKKPNMMPYNIVAIMDEEGPVFFNNEENLRDLGYNLDELELSGFYSPLFDIREFRNTIKSQLKFMNESSSKNAPINNFFKEKKEKHSTDYSFCPSCIDFTKKVRVKFYSNEETSRQESEEIVVNINDNYPFAGDSKEVDDHSFCLVKLANNALTFGLIDLYKTERNTVELLSVYNGNSFIPLDNGFSLFTEDKQLSTEEIFPITYKKIGKAIFKNLTFQFIFNETKTVTLEESNIQSAFMENCR